MKPLGNHKSKETKDAGNIGLLNTGIIIYLTKFNAKHQPNHSFSNKKKLITSQIALSIVYESI